MTDADISYGNSGGAALDSYGRLIGIPTFGVTEGASWIGYLRSVDVVMDWVGDLDSEEDNFTSFPILEIKEFNPLIYQNTIEMIGTHGQMMMGTVKTLDTRYYS